MAARKTPKSLIPMIGKTFGQATVLSLADSTDRRIRYICKCSCGAEFITQGDYLRSGHTQSCGCYQKSQARQAQETHGETSHHTRSPEYMVWRTMIARCTNKDNHKYQDYGGRGIRVCRRWRKYENFLSDMGRRPTPKHTIDRIKNNENYVPSNCRWATAKEQSNNRRNNVLLIYQNRTQTMDQWCDELGLKYGRVRERIVMGWTVEDAFTKPPRILQCYPLNP